MSTNYFIEPMCAADADEAMRWMDARIQKNSGNPNVVFPRLWVPKTGQAVLNDAGHLYAVSFVYFEKTAEIAYCGWLLANPENTARESYRAVKMLVNAMPTYARSQGAKCLLTVYGNRGINRLLEKSGFHNGENCESKFKLLF